MTRGSLQRAAPYAATFLAVLVLLTVAFLQGPRADSRTRNDASTGMGSPVPPSPSPMPTSSADTPSRTAQPPPSAVPATSASTPATTVATTVRTARAPRIIAWIRDLGLTGGGGSWPEAFLAELSWGQCPELLRDVTSAPREEVDLTTRNLYLAAAQACLAAFHAKPSLWPAADSGVERLSGASGDFNCIELSVYALTRALVKLHRSEPDAVLRRGNADDADGPDCPRVRSVDPPSGPAAGGYQVRIVGDHLPGRAVVHFGEVTRTVPTTDGRVALFTVPPMGQYSEVSVWVEGWPYEVNHSPSFSYESSPGDSHGP
jgi:hypothetical protein